MRATKFAMAVNIMCRNDNIGAKHAEIKVKQSNIVCII